MHVAQLSSARAEEASVVESSYPDSWLRSTNTLFSEGARILAGVPSAKCLERPCPHPRRNRGYTVSRIKQEPPG